MKRSINGKKVLITGASSGIGRALAIAMAAKGAMLHLTARRKELLVSLQKELAEKHQSSVQIHVGDVCDSDFRKDLLTSCTETGLDILVNNAGITALGRFDEAGESRLRQIFEVNFFAPVELTRCMLQLLKAGNKPAVVNVGSVLGHRATPLKSEYCASKFAVHGFSDAIRAELDEQKVDVILISPSTTRSELFDAALEDKTNRNWLSGAMPAEKVATKAIRAIEKGKHEVILSFGGKALVWLDRICPPLANFAVRKFG